MEIAVVSDAWSMLLKLDSSIAARETSASTAS
jgi:hypothetical protein